MSLAAMAGPVPAAGRWLTVHQGLQADGQGGDADGQQLAEHRVVVVPAEGGGSHSIASCAATGGAAQGTGEGGGPAAPHLCQPVRTMPWKRSGASCGRACITFSQLRWFFRW